MLFRLQQLDSQIEQFGNSINEINLKLADDTSIQAAQNSVRITTERQQADRQTLLSAERSVQDLKIKIEQNEATLYSGKIQNPKELQDLQNDILSQKRFLVILEDRLLEAMLANEESENYLKLAESELVAANARNIENNARLLGERTRLSDQLKRLKAERQTAVTPIQPEDIITYEQLRRQRKGIAVVKISGKACAACGTTLAPAVIQLAQSPMQLVRCPTCSRILYQD